MRTSSLRIFSLRRFAAVACLGAVMSGVCPAATLSFDAPLHIQPNSNSPVIGTLPAGTSIPSLLRQELQAAGLQPPPPGWTVIRSAGPFQGFVRNADVNDDGTIKPGAEVRLQPLADAPLLLEVDPADDATASEPLGDWSRATIRTELFVYVNSVPPGSRSQGVVAPANTMEGGSGTDDELVLNDPRVEARPQKPRKPKRTREPKVEPVPVETEGAPRTFVGYLLRTRRILGRGPKYDYQLVDENNDRIALLDVSALLATSPVASFENRRVSVYGPGLTRPDVKDVILRVQTLRLLP